MIGRIGLQANAVAAALAGKIMGGAAGGVFTTIANGFGAAANFTKIDSTTDKKGVVATNVLGRLFRVLGGNAVNSGMAR